MRVFVEKNDLTKKYPEIGILFEKMPKNRLFLSRFHIKISLWNFRVIILL